MNDKSQTISSNDGIFPTVCTICEASCGMLATVENGKITKLKPDRDNPHSRGHVCIKGTAATGLVYNEDRVLTPLKAIDKNGNFEPVSWEDALDDIAARTKATLEEHGSEAFGSCLGNPIFFSVFGFPAILAFLGALKSRKNFSALSQDNLSRMIANEYIYGHVSKMPIPDLENCDLLIVLGSNMLVSNGSMITTARIREQLEGISKRGRVIMIDPRRTESAERYEHQPIKVGTDIWLLSAMVNTLFQKGWFDADFLEKEVVGWQQLREAVAHITPEVAEKHCGIAADTIVTLTDTFYHTPRSAITSRTGICRNEFASFSNVLVDALNIIGGKFSEEGGTMLGHKMFGGELPEIPDSQSRIEGIRTMGGLWMPNIVMSAEMTEPGPDRLRSLFMVAGNPLNSGPGGEGLREALKGLDLFVACDLFINDSNQYADYILPTTTFLERPNMPFITAEHMVEPALQFTEAVIEAQGDAKTEEWIFSQLMERVFGQALPPISMIIDQQIQEGCFGSIPIDGDEGLSLQKLREHPHGLALPELDKEVRWRAGVVHDDGKLHLWHEDFDGEYERLASTDRGDALRLFGRRDIRSMNSWLHNVERLVRSQKPTLLVHPEDAQARGIQNGAMVTLSNQYGTIEVEAEISDEIMPGSVNYPHGWGHDGGWKRAVAAGGANINLLAPSDPAVVERLSGTSILDGIAVELS